MKSNQFHTDHQLIFRERHNQHGNYSGPTSQTPAVFLSLYYFQVLLIPGKNNITNHVSKSLLFLQLSFKWHVFSTSCDVCFALNPCDSHCTVSTLLYFSRLQEASPKVWLLVGARPLLSMVITITFINLSIIDFPRDQQHWQRFRYVVVFEHYAHRFAGLWMEKIKINKFDCWRSWIHLIVRSLQS